MHGINVVLHLINGFICIIKSPGYLVELGREWLCNAYLLNQEVQLFVRGPCTYVHCRGGSVGSPWVGCRLRGTSRTDDVTTIEVSYWRRREFTNYARLHRGRIGDKILPASLNSPMQTFIFHGILTISKQKRLPGDQHITSLYFAGYWYWRICFGAFALVILK